MGRQTVIAVVSGKGGTGKSTSAVHIAAILAKEPGGAALVDMDPQASSLKWGRDLPFPVVDVDGLSGDWAWVVIDTPPSLSDTRAVRAALGVAHVVVVPLRPLPLDLAELPDTRAVIAEVQKARKRTDSPGPVDRYLLTQVRAGTRSAAYARQAMGEAVGERLLRAQIPMREAVGMSPLADSLDGWYDPVVEELKACVLEAVSI